MGNKTVIDQAARDAVMKIAHKLGLIGFLMDDSVYGLENRIPVEMLFDENKILREKIDALANELGVKFVRIESHLEAVKKGKDRDD
jgi:hypothetical protein